MLANLKGEDSEAWKYYLHKGMTKEALNSKTINDAQKANVAGIYADDKFQTGRYKKAAEYYA
jgi:cytochrome c-type biogenesis protein CcmH/NrfG